MDVNSYRGTCENGDLGEGKQVEEELRTYFLWSGFERDLSRESKQTVKKLRSTKKVHL